MRVSKSYIFIWIIWCVLTNAVQDEKEKFLVKKKNKNPLTSLQEFSWLECYQTALVFLWTGGKLNAVISRGFEVVDYESEVRN